MPLNETSPFRQADTSGKGGLYHSGRWHCQGTLILYTAEHLSLAKLEMLTNSPMLTVNYSVLPLEVPAEASCHYVEAADLPTDWVSLPHPPELATITVAPTQNRSAISTND